MSPRRWLLVLLVIGCRDAQMDPFADALSDYDRGRAAAEAGDWATAREAFQAAAESHPLSPSLRLWLAEAHAQAGDLDAARDVLGQGIAVTEAPELQQDMRYNRAAYAARAGDLEAAAKDLQYLYARELLSPTEAGEDADFAALSASTDPRLAAMAPPPRVEAEATLPQDPLLLGERYTAEIALKSREDRPLAAALEPGAPGARAFLQERVIEDLVSTEGGWELRRLTLEWRAVASGTETLGPVTFSAHGSSATVGPLPVEVTLLPGQQPPPPPAEGGAPATLWLPSALLGGQEAPWIGRLPDGRAVALMLPGMSASRGERQEEVVRLEYREGGQTAWLADVFPPASGGEEQAVTIRRGSREILQQKP